MSAGEYRPSFCSCWASRCWASASVGCLELAPTPHEQPRTRAIWRNSTVAALIPFIDRSPILPFKESFLLRSCFKLVDDIDYGQVYFLLSWGQNRKRRRRQNVFQGTLPSAAICGGFLAARCSRLRRAGT